MPRMRFTPALAATAVLAALLRVPFLNTPTTVDEGGYAYVARFWARGADLYGDVWVDRPQGLLLEYRAALALLGDDGVAVRLLATLTAVAITVVLGLMLKRLVSPTAGLIGAALFAVVSVGPSIEGFSANGELLSALPSTMAIGLAISWQRRPRRATIVLCGLVAGAALLVKQSGYDAGLAVALWLLLAAWRRWHPRREALVALALLVAGGVVPVALAALHGALTGWHDWWFAFADYRLSVESVTTAPVSERLSLLWHSRNEALPAIGPLLVLLPFGIAAAWAEARSRLLIIWFALSLSGFALGGLFHGHYYVGLVAPLTALGAVGIARIVRDRPPRVALAAVAIACVVPFCALALVAAEDGPRHRSLASSGDDRIVTDAAVARYLRAHTRPSDRIYALYADASIYFVADRRSPYPYLWFLGVKHIPGAIERLRTTLAGPDAPLYIARYQPADAIDAGVARIVARDYRHVATVDGIPILRRTA